MPSSHSLGSCGLNVRSRPAPRFVLNSVILPTLLYGLECTILLEPHVHRLESFFICCLRIVLGISVRKQKRHTTICKIAKQQKDLIDSHTTSSPFSWASQGCPMIAYPSSFLCLLLFVASAMLVDRSVVGMMLYLVTSKQCNLLESWREKAEERNSWHSISKRSAEHFNKEAKDKEKSLRDDRK